MKLKATLAGIVALGGCHLGLTPVRFTGHVNRSMDKACIESITEILSRNCDKYFVSDRGIYCLKSGRCLEEINVAGGSCMSGNSRGYNSNMPNTERCCVRREVVADVKVDWEDTLYADSVGDRVNLEKGYNDHLGSIPLKSESEASRMSKTINHCL